MFFSLAGLIDYNFHCFRKAIHEVFEVGVTSHRSCGHQTGAPSLKALAHNGTPRNAIQPEFQGLGLCATLLFTPGSDATCYRTWELLLVEIWCLSHQRQGVEFLIWMETPSTSGVQLKRLFLFLKNAKKNSRDHRTQVCFSPLWGPTLVGIFWTGENTTYPTLWGMLPSITS